MKQLMGVLVLASTVGLAIAATASARTERSGTSCAAIEAAIRGDVAAAQKAATVGDYKTEFRIANDVKALVAQAKTCTTSNGAGTTAPAKFSRSTDVAHIGKPYGPVTFCPHPAGKYCNDAAGKRITFHLFGVFLPLGMRFDAFTGTVSGTPSVGQSPQDVHLHVCSYELLGHDQCHDTILFLRK